MATNKDKSTDADETNPEVETFLTDPKHQKERDFMQAVIRKTMADDAVAAKEKSTNVGGTFIDNFLDGLTGGLFSDDGKK
jgi:hypothetical protein